MSTLYTNTITPASGSSVTVTSELTASQGVSVPDDQKLRFGTDADASIEYNEDGDNNLVISGSTTGLVLSGSKLTLDTTTVASGSIAGAGSYLGVTSAGQVVLTSSSGTSTTPGGSDTQIQYNNGGSFGGVASLTYNDSTGHITVIDDKKLLFGTGGDASVEYDEDNTNKLIISGAAAGFDIDLPDNVASAFEISEDANSYITITTTNSSEGIKFSQDVTVIDDKKLWFGTGEDAYIEYDENGDNFLTISGSAAGLALSGTMVSFDPLTVASGSIAGLGSYLGVTSAGKIVLTSSGLPMGGSDGQLQYNNAGDHGGITSFTYNDSTGDLTIIDDKKLYFGTNTDGYIEYNEDGDNFLTISGSATGLALSGTKVSFDPLTVGSGSVAGLGSYLGITSTGQIVLTSSTTAAVGSDTQLQYNNSGSFGGVASLTYNDSTGHLTVIDDKKLYFGTNNDAYIEYDEDGDNFLTISGSAAGLALSGTIVEVATNIKIKDDKKLYFGTNNDAYIEYDEDGTDELILSGAQGGIDIQAPDGVADGLTISAGGAAYVTLDTTSAEQTVTANKEFVFAAGAVVNDDQKLVFGSDDESHIEYNENGDNFLTISGSAAGLALSGTIVEVATNIKIKDDKKLYFGNGNDAYIEYDEDGTDELILSGAQGGIDIQVPIPVTDALTISSNGTAYMTFDTSDEAINVHQALLVADDTKIEFGAGADASIEYDEDGTDELRFAGAAATFEQDVSFDNNVTLGVAATDVTTVTGRLTASQGMLVADDQKLYFGNNNDAYIEYDENGDDVLVIGGTAIEFKLPDDDDAALVVKEGSTAYMTFDTTDGDEIIQSNKEHEFVSGAIVQDDQKLYFGDDNDAYISYDEAGTDELILSGAQGGIDIQAPDGVADGLTISAGGAAYITLDTTSDEQVVTANKEFVFAAGGIVEDDQQLIFGSDDDAYIKYNENGDDYLVISGSATGIAMTGSSIVLDGNTKVKNDYHTVTFESQLSDGDMGSGDILYYEPGGDSALTKGGIYYLHTDGTWNAADADAASTGKQLLGIALGTSARTHGVLIRGFVKIPSTEVLNVPGSGASDGLPVYLSTTAAHIDFTAPSASGDIVRVIGYCIDDDSSDILLLFRPDNTWVEIA